MSTAGVDFGQKVGPLPMGAWVAVVGGGLGLYMLQRNRAAATATPTIDPTASLVGTGGAGAAGGSYTPTNGSSGLPATTGAAITTNQQWGAQAFSWLAGMGMAPDVVDVAIRNYLAGESLTIQQNALIAQALGKFGQPPEGLPSAPVLPVVPPAPDPAPSPNVNPAPAPVKKVNPLPVAPPRNVTHKVKLGESLSSIAAQYRDPRITWQSIFNANRGIIHSPNLIYPGQILVIA